MAPFYCSREASPRFRQAAADHIVNISSLAGKNAFSGGAGYNAAKAGLNGFTEALMLDHRNEHVRVTSIMPGSVNTEFSHPARRHQLDDSARRRCRSSRLRPSDSCTNHGQQCRYAAVNAQEVTARTVSPDQ